MKEISQEEQDKLMDVLRRNQERLKSFKGVHYIDVGYRYVNKHPTGELAIRVHLYNKRPESELEAGEALPQTIEGIPIDVIQSNPQLEYTPRDQRVDPLVGGVQIANPHTNTAGTLGIVVCEPSSGTLLGLSNYHVLVGKKGVAGDNIVQPATTNQNDVIGTLSRWSKRLDCAVFILNTSRSVSRGIVDYPSGATALQEPLVGMRVTKSGKTTGTTSGIIDGVSLNEFTVVPDPDNPSPDISGPGDSGSVWLRSADLAAIGLHFAGETDPDPKADRAWAKRMVKVAQALDFRLLEADPGRSKQMSDPLKQIEEATSFFPREPEGEDTDELIRFVQATQAGTGNGDIDSKLHDYANLLRSCASIATKYLDDHKLLHDDAAWTNVYNKLPLFSLAQWKEVTFSRTLQGTAISGELLKFIVSGVIGDPAVTHNFEQWIGGVGEKVAFGVQHNASGCHMHLASMISEVVHVGSQWRYVPKLKLYAVHFTADNSGWMHLCHSHDQVTVNLSFTEMIKLFDYHALEDKKTAEGFKKFLAGTAMADIEQPEAFFQIIARIDNVSE